MSKWARTTNGRYVRREDNVLAIVYLVGELWRSFVYYEGEIVDQGEWDGRSTAFKNAVSGMRRARDLRAPLMMAARFERDEDDPGDPFP